MKKPKTKSTEGRLFLCFVLLIAVGFNIRSSWERALQGQQLSAFHSVHREELQWSALEANGLRYWLVAGNQPTNQLSFFDGAYLLQDARCFFVVNASDGNGFSFQCSAMEDLKPVPSWKKKPSW